MYKTLIYFTDLQDGDHAYNPGDTFPRKGLKVSDDRLAELASDRNLRGVPLIEKVEEKKPPKKRGGKRANEAVQGAE